MQPTLSVVIPTHKRPEILAQCLAHLAKQTIVDQLEVIIVDDAGNSEPAHNPLLTTHYINVPPCHQGAARNRGAQEAHAPLTLFIGDDILLAPDACEKHVAVHERNENGAKPIAVLGFVTWDPSLEITATMQWLEKTGWQFGYNMLTRYRHAFVPTNMQHRFTYTSFISVPTLIARSLPFRRDLTMYGWEDMLWGQELQSAEVRLYYEPDAVGYHNHPISLDDSLARIETLGQSLLHISKAEPQMSERVPTGWKLLLYRLIALLPIMRGRHYKAFLKGLRKDAAY
jgi:glycosyltransferase involved in cell wall biosynthesis